MTCCFCRIKVANHTDSAVVPRLGTAGMQSSPGRAPIAHCSKNWNQTLSTTGCFAGSSNTNQSVQPSTQQFSNIGMTLHLPHRRHASALKLHFKLLACRWPLAPPMDRLRGLLILRRSSLKGLSKGRLWRSWRLHSWQNFPRPVLQSLRADLKLLRGCQGLQTSQLMGQAFWTLRGASILRRLILPAVIKGRLSIFDFENQVFVCLCVLTPSTSNMIHSTLFQIEILWHHINRQTGTFTFLTSFMLQTPSLLHEKTVFGRQDFA